MKMSTGERGRIVRDGMGGFLNPPTHPEHTLSVQIDLCKKPESRGSMSLSYAAEECDYLHEDTRNAVRRTLAAWVPPPIDSIEIQRWVTSVLGYFKNCYRNPAAVKAEQWNCDKLVIDDRDPILFADDHAGVRLIRKFYPDFVPTAEQFGKARWGSKED